MVVRCKALWGFFFGGTCLMGEVANSVEVPWLLMDVAQEARHSALKLHFEKPSGWQFLETNEPFVLFEMTEASSAIKEKRDELPTITLLARGSFGKSLDDFSELIADGIKLTHPGSKIVIQQKRELLKFPAQQNTLALDVVNPTSADKTGGGMMLTLMTAVDGDIGYLLLYTARESEFFEKMNAFEEVVRTLHFEEEIGLDPLIRHQILAQEYGQAGHWEGAIQEVEQMRLLRPKDKELQNSLSYLYAAAGNVSFVQLGDLAKAEEMFHRAMELNPNQPQVKKTLELVQTAKKETVTLPLKKGDK
jgi:tetratricopeptide (TPR) repeat protein